MIEKEQLQEALLRIGEKEAYGPPAHEWVISQGVDWGDLVDCSVSNAEAFVKMGLAPAEGKEVIALAFVAGFTLAMQTFENERKNNGDA